MKPATIRDVAARAGVSKSLVSLVLADSPKVTEAKRQQVLTAIEELGFRPNANARNLALRRTKVVGVLVSDLDNPFFVDVLKGVERVLEEHGLRVMVFVGGSRERDERALEVMLELRADGLILVSPDVTTHAMTDAAGSAPLVVVARDSSAAEVDCVLNDDARGTELAVDYLHSEGHEWIAYISAPQRRRQRDLRQAGYERAMRHLGLADKARVYRGDFTEAGGRKGAAALLRAGDPITAVIAANDLAAIGVLSALEHRGIRVPEDISVVGYDNTAFAHLERISLTTVNQERDAMGEHAARLLVGRLDGEADKPTVVRLEPSLAIRDTVAPAPSKTGR